MFLVGICVGCLLNLTAQGQGLLLPTYKVARTPGPIKIDGKLDDDALVESYHEAQGLSPYVTRSWKFSSRPILIQPSYIELEVNPLRAMLDIYMLAARKPLH
jgi:hypothetical protein